MSADRQFQISDDWVSILNELGGSGSLHDRVKVTMAVGAFSSKMVSLARAAELADLSLVDFIEVLKERGIPWMDYTEEAWEMDKEALRKLREAKKKESNE